MIDALEDAIVERLKPAFPAVLVEAFPENYQDFDTLPLNRGAAILVGYKGSDFGGPQSLGAIVQNQRAQIEIQIISTSRRGKGVLALLAATRARLTGFRPLGADPLYPVDERYLPSKPSIWVYSLTMATSWPHVEIGEPDEEAPFVLATNINETTGNAWQVDLHTEAFTEESP